MTHETVLLHESIDGLDIHEGDVFVDGTLGGGGHSEEVAKEWGDKVSIVGIDRDADALERSRARLDPFSSRLYLAKEDYRNIDKVLSAHDLNHADRILLDLGLSSFQLEESGRGFSFKNEEPLHMTFSKDPHSQLFNADDIVNEWEESSIADVIYGYGEERYARRIARAIVEKRANHRIKTAAELAKIIEEAMPPITRKFSLKKRPHPATKTFQALRITVNDELGALKEGLQKGFELLSPGGRMAVISFHSLEDRIVKHFYKDKEKEGFGTIITKKAIVPAESEIRDNPRSRSAKLRIISKK